MLADELLARLRIGLNDEVEYAEPPVELGGGFFTANHRFSIRSGPAGWEGPMVLRLFPDHAPVGLDGWEAAVQAFAHDRGVPAPAVTLRDPSSTIDDRWWAHIADPIDGAPSHPLMPGIDWLRRNAPEPRSPLALCHGDSWGGNLLVENGEVTGLIDWSVATVAEPALEIAFLTMALSLAPVPMPRPIQRIAQRIGRRLAVDYRAAYESGSDIDLTSMPYYEALRCLLELSGVVSYRTTVAQGATYDGPRPTWDAIADQMTTYFAERTGVRLDLPPAVH